MVGPLWDFFMKVSSAVTVEPDRMVYLHPDSKGTMTRVTTLSDEERAAAQRAVGRRGMSDQLRALYPSIPAPQQRHPAQKQLGSDSVRGNLLGGAVSLGSAALAAGSSSSSVVVEGRSAMANLIVAMHESRGTSSQPSVDAVGSLASPSRPAALAVAATDPVYNSGGGVDSSCAARLAHAPPGLPLPVYFTFTNAAETQATWCGHELQLFRGDVCCYWGDCWFVLNGLDPRKFPYSKQTHWWTEWGRGQ
jgi:hypothetical protein